MSIPAGFPFRPTFTTLIFIVAPVSLNLMIPILIHPFLIIHPISSFDSTIVNSLHLIIPQVPLLHDFTSVRLNGGRTSGEVEVRLAAAKEEEIIEIHSDDGNNGDIVMGKAGEEMTGQTCKDTTVSGNMGMPGTSHTSKGQEGKAVKPFDFGNPEGLVYGAKTYFSVARASTPKAICPQ
ncbi:hypothetical protein H1R20_g7501, partial [Candolleomyces eurysporus]